MLYIYSLIFGLIQGLTEFIPVSSSGHLVVLHNILNFDLSQNLAFDVALHLGTALALIIFFRIEIIKYLVALLEIFIPKRKVNRTDLNDILLIIYATIPAAIIGFMFEDAIKSALRSPVIVAIALIIGALLFFVVEKFAKHNRDFSGMGIGRALYIGLAQALALIPGVSRSGITIVAGMSAKLKRAEAARFTFLISIPIVLGAGLYKMLDLNWNALSNSEVSSFVLGFLSSFVVGFFVIKYLLKFLSRHKLNAFAWYRIALAIVILIVVFLK